MARYRIYLDRDSCVGDGLCREIARRTFDIGREGKVTLLDPEGDDPEILLMAAGNCPFGCITLFDAETGRRANVERLAGSYRTDTQASWHWWRDLGGGD